MEVANEISFGGNKISTSLHTSTKQQYTDGCKESHTARHEIFNLKYIANMVQTSKTNECADWTLHSGIMMYYVI